jgi:dienelactone hydrolase
MSRISRRGFLGKSATFSVGLGFMERLAKRGLARPSFGNGHIAAADSAPATLPGTAPLTQTGDLAAQMVEGIHKYLLRATEESAQERARRWNLNLSSSTKREAPMARHRERLRKIIGAVDTRVSAPSLDILAANAASPEAGRGAGFRAYRARWSVCDPAAEDYSALEGEGLLLEPDGPAVARVVAVPDADWSPERLAGLAPGVPEAGQFARRLAENGCQVLIPVLIDRSDEWSGIPGIKMTNQPHREWIYRMAFEVGRHVIGLEVQKILAAIDWFTKENVARSLPLGVMGYGEGGLLALYSSALDPRIDATVVSGYFQPRQQLWTEPIYRDVWAFLEEFGDAELAGMIAPRALIVEACATPQVDGPPPARDGRAETACPNGTLRTPALEDVTQEVERARGFFSPLQAKDKLQLVVSGEGQGLPGSEEALGAFLRAMGRRQKLRPRGSLPHSLANYDPGPRLHRQFDQMVSFTQGLIRVSPERRREFWGKLDHSSPQPWTKATQSQRDYIWEEVIGRLPQPSIPANARSRLLYETATLRGYEVMLDVWPDVFAFGILVLPKDLKPGEKRPVVVCQHGLEGRPDGAADPRSPDGYMHHFAVSLAEEGFITYAPQNPYIGEDRFRTVQRLGHPLKLALFSFIIGQHARTLEWLAQLPFVDPERIGFYGISYGGKTAVRVPPFVGRYAVSICTADFNEWVWKTTSVDSAYSYMLLPEYDMYEFDFANVVNYAELAELIAPRPFMVERGHRDGVAPDEWVAYEYATVRRFYAEMGIPQNTAIEWWNGPHAIHGVGTFEFLRRHLRWPGQGVQEG